MNDPKELLSRAFGEEPPLRIDRDEVIQQGRKRLRRRRFFEAGGVVAAVLVAAVGAATLTKLSGDEPGTLPPAASRTDVSSATPVPSPPPTTSPTMPTTSPGAQLLEPDLLLKLLYDSTSLREGDVAVTLGMSGRPRFRPMAEEYVYEADVIRTKTPGSLTIRVDLDPGTRLDCDQVPPPYSGCGFTTRAGVPVLLARYDDPSGQRGTYAAVVLDNGVQVVATTTNLTSYDPKVSPTGRPPALTEDELSDLVVKVGGGAV